MFLMRFPAQAAADPSILFVVLMGICTVMIGLTCIIFICMAMSAITKKFAKAEAPAKVSAAPAQTAAPAPIQNRGELVAAIAAAVAEDLGADVSAIRIHSIKRIDK